jgi:hypothetical protein
MSKAFWPVFLLSALSVSAALAEDGPETFSSSTEAAQALVKASEADDTGAMMKLFAPNGKDLIESGDPAEDKANRARFAKAAAKKLALVPDPEDANKLFVTVGENEWPFPVPLIQKDGAWVFDTSEGADEVLAREIGRHELTAIEICRGYVEAQNQYAQIHSAKGIPEYAQNIVSSPGKEDGLYWKPKKGTLPSPVPKDFARAAHSMDPAKRVPYHGYYFQILTSQGPHARSGAKNYVVDGAMTGGYALVAWPADYGESGITTFLVNQEGGVYQKDLGAETDKLAPALTEFDPDSSWTEAKPE